MFKFHIRLINSSNQKIRKKYIKNIKENQEYERKEDQELLTSFTDILFATLL